MATVYSFDEYMAGEMADGATARELSTHKEYPLGGARGLMWAALFEASAALVVVAAVMLWRIM